VNTFPDSNTNARASVVNRVHRIVREQAMDMREQKERKRSLWVPLAIFSVLLPLICYAAWAMLEGYDDAASIGIPDASDQLVVMMMWFIPVTAIVLGSVWFRRSRMNGQEVSR
jgi:protein-S-isoprenylcysteine O-methyltransferase Ste14